jgi:hypothetical protein
MLAVTCEQAYHGGCLLEVGEHHVFLHHRVVSSRCEASKSSPESHTSSSIFCGIFLVIGHLLSQI